MVTERLAPGKLAPTRTDALGSPSFYVRKAVSHDVRSIAALVENKRTEYRQYHTRFWREATDAPGRFLPALENLLQDDRVIVLVMVQEGKVNGVIIGALQQAPAIYDPGGLTCVVDDFFVAAPALWNSVGMALLYALTREARSRGAVQVAITCARKDMRKRSMLVAHKYDVTAEWFVRDLAPAT
jgi:GNAT superfamily N-acetyltransferase